MLSAYYVWRIYSNLLQTNFDHGSLRYEPWSDCSKGSCLIWFYTVCNIGFPTVQADERANNNCELTLCLLVLSADNFCKQFGTRSGPTKCRALITIQTVWHFDDIPEIIFRKSWFWKIQQTIIKKNMQNYPVGIWLIIVWLDHFALYFQIYHRAILATIS